MRFIVALLIASSQAIQIPHPSDTRDTIWVKPAEEQAQNTNAPAPAHNNEPGIIEFVHKGRIESNSGS